MPVPIFALMLAAAVPAENPGNWILAEDYPARALRDGIEGKSTVVLTISPDGKPIGCQISISSGSADLDDATCKLLTERGRFETSSTGTTQSFSTVVEWKIPPTPLMPVSTSGFAALTDLSNGRVVGNCKSSTIGQPNEQLDICELLSMPGATEAMNFADFKEATKLQIRLVVAPKNIPLPTVFAFSPNIRNTVLLKARFDVDAGGAPGNCQVVENFLGAEVEGLCDDMVSTEPQFDVANANAFPVTMDLTIDATAGTPR